MPDCFDAAPQRCKDRIEHLSVCFSIDHDSTSPKRARASLAEYIRCFLQT